MIVWRTIALVGTVAALARAGDISAECVFPARDGDQESAPSRHAFEGEITGIIGSIIYLRGTTSGTNSTRASVRLAHDTKLFTVHGGHVGHDELKPRQWVRIWLPACGHLRAKSVATAAVVQLASTESGKAFPPESQQAPAAGSSNPRPR